VRIAVYTGGLLGLTLLVFLLVRSDLDGLLQLMASGGWALLWVVPYRALFFLLYAAGWRILLQPYDPQQRAGLGYLTWVASVREAIDRLLPVASVGGAIIGVRLLRWRGLGLTPVAATVIIEILLTLVVSYLFAAAGMLLLSEYHAGSEVFHHLLVTLLLTLPVPVATTVLLRRAAVFHRLERLLGGLVGLRGKTAGNAVALDDEVRACLQRTAPLFKAAALQCAALVSGSFEVWLALRLLGHPVNPSAAVILESLNQAVRHLAFVIPAGIGVQEAGLILTGHVLGLGPELALGVSMVKRMRELLCAAPSLISWQWMEARRLRALAQDAP
jgi:putative membrane protein